MLLKFAQSVALLAAFAVAVPAPQLVATGTETETPSRPEAALRPLWTDGMPTRPDVGDILPTGPDNETESTNDLTIMATIHDQYKFWKGNGKNWPKMAAWGSFDQLWSANLPLMRQSCGWNGWGANNNNNEINYIKTAIKQVAKESSVESRFILAIIMQETGGCVRAPTTANGVRNPGLMQSHNGSGTCAGKNPCPNKQILQMIRDGTSGTKSGDGLKQCLAKVKKVITNAPYRATFAAARKYNSGSVDYNNLNNPFTARKCYSCDVANRLTGWTNAKRTCS
ncbi:unnamed protein product [Clonostachys rosea f. rosea IK726]|jgi:hypothetical protein|uniref:Transglycosylase SLT domain-containing protein n=2 Tax=Bionectria ochroleuca TaxID=29856 RepID=A0A0B7JV65_BIOOC|nr:unnamed protein product [Clonostachys rosea f. rosea IK726]